MDGKQLYIFYLDVIIIIAARQVVEEFHFVIFVCFHERNSNHSDL
jgi:hypothetical protein